MKERWEDKVREAIDEFEKENPDPRVLVLGSTGVGKSSLINNIFGRKLHAVDRIKSTTREFTTNVFEVGGTRILITDSPGYGEIGHDREYSASVVSEASATHVVLLVLKGDEKGYQRDIDILSAAARDPDFSLEKPVLIALNQIDKLPPVRDWSPPYDFTSPLSEEDSEKIVNVKRKLMLVREQFDPVFGSRTVRIRPTMAEPADGDIYGIAETKQDLFELLPDVAKFKYARAAKLAENASQELIKLLDLAANDVISMGSKSAAIAVGANPIPASDYLTLIPIQVLMIIKMGALYGVKVDWATGKEILFTLGAGFTARTVFQGVISLVPGVKNLAGPVWAAATTYGMGMAAKAYFQNGQVPSQDEIKRIINDEVNQRKGE